VRAGTGKVGACMRVCVHAGLDQGGVRVREHVCVHACMHACVCVRACASVCVRVCMPVCICDAEQCRPLLLWQCRAERAQLGVAKVKSGCHGRMLPVPVAPAAACAGLLNCASCCSCCWTALLLHSSGVSSCTQAVVAAAEATRFT